MSKPIYLPYSAMTKFSFCPKLYELHYNERLRPVELNSTLLFGVAVDSAAEEYLKTKNRELCRRKFRDMWNEQEQDGKTIEIAGSLEVTYSKNDLDIELIPEPHHKLILKDSPFKTLSDLVQDGQDKQRIANATWFCLYTKGSLMLKAFMDWVDQNVEEVLGTQLQIELEDEEGNKVPGLADFVVKIKGYDKPILIDLKTSARYYDRNSVKESEQLGLYFFYLKQAKFPTMERAGYLVLNKQIRKNKTKTCLKCGHVTTGREKTCAVGEKKDRCSGEFSIDMQPEAMVQYIHDVIPEPFILETINKFNICVEKIKVKEFTQCLDKCESYYGRRCPYYDYCRTGSTDGLVKKERSNDSSRNSGTSKPSG